LPTPRREGIACLDDALNYLLGDDDLARALASMARLLRPGGLLARRRPRPALPGARLQPDDESVHTKLVYLARRSSPTTEEGGNA
jgi:hypothetical protein